LFSSLPRKSHSIPHSSDSLFHLIHLPQSTIITLIPTVLSLYAFIIHHHYPRILHFTHSPQSPHATRSTDSSHHLVTHRIRSYFILSTYTTLPTLLVVDYVGALRGGFQFFWYSFADRTNLVFSHFSFLHCLIFHNFNLVMLQQSSSRTYNCSLSLTSSSSKGLKGLHHFLRTQISFTTNYTGSLNCCYKNLTV
jgi:hypothetical protein